MQLRSTGSRINQAGLMRSVMRRSSSGGGGGLFGSGTPAGVVLGDAETAGLAADFTASPTNMLVRSVGGALDYSGLPFADNGGRIVNSRTGTATVIDSDGLLKWARHNLVLRSQEFDNASWIKTQTSVPTADATTAPDGTTTADLIAETATTNVHIVGSANIAQVNGVSYTWRIWAKKGPGATAPDWIQLTFGTAGWGSSQFANFNLTTGLAGTVTGGTASITAAPNGFYLLSFTATSTSGTSANCVVAFTNNTDAASRAPNYLGAVTSDVYLWGGHAYRSDLGGMQSNGTAFPSYNVTTSAVFHGPRIEHTLVTGTRLGLLLEESRVNTVLQSNDFTNAVWNKTSLTAALTATGPDGVANSASTLTATANDAFAQQYITSGNNPRAASIFIKRRTGTGNVFLSYGQTTGSELVTNGTFTVDASGWTNSTGAVAISQVGFQGSVANTGAGWSYQAITVTPGTPYIFAYQFVTRAGSGEIRLGTSIGGNEITSIATTGLGKFAFVPTASTIYISLGDAAGGSVTNVYDGLSILASVETSLTVTGSWSRPVAAISSMTNPIYNIRLATSGDAVDVYCAQLETQSGIAGPTSPIPTTTASVTRAADAVATVATSLFPYVDGAAGTLFLDFTNLDPVTIGGGLIGIRGSTTDHCILTSNAGVPTLRVAVASVVQAGEAVGSAMSFGARASIAGAWNTNDFIAARSGTLSAGDVSGTIPTGLTSLELRTLGNSASVRNILIHRMFFVPRRMSNTELQSRTT